MEFRLPETSPGRAARPPGWWRWAGIGGGVLVAVLFLALLAGMFSARRVLSWGLRRITTRVEAALPADLPPARREELHRRLDCVVAEAEAGRADERRLGELARACSQAVKTGSVSPEALDRIEVLAGGLCAEGGGELPN
ncbi:MAG: hypothetical protein B7Z68_12830 [Acidobacteria bacterium 21-70-11]|nr:MAG: hypothetical protein B7Z68_12830 [Acidobacteria bacterium 21-70-11]OYW05472.1 MAG: hypothetical protein B7Z61_06010 [Acidobacteria bacterium 37-71-11]HQU33085.1 hypothetical protein [Thermoanaerobaculaceae bacterium]